MKATVREGVGREACPHPDRGRNAQSCGQFELHRRKQEREETRQTADPAHGPNVLRQKYRGNQPQA